MCGISGVFNLNSQPVDGRALKSMITLIRHRGPDGTGFMLANSRSGQLQTFDAVSLPNQHRFDVGLAHCRLSIIDLSQAGRQPMCNEDETLWLTYNGEIYNYKELIPELKSYGHQFKSQTDSEVILHAYEQWGEDCVNRFNGMWAFAIWDVKKQRLFCSRDRFGVKPFYYYYDGKKFIFASEIKSVLSCLAKREVNHRAVYNFLEGGFGFMDMSQETFFKNIIQLRPAHTMTVGKAGLKMHQYWTVPLKDRTVSEKEHVETFKDLFIDSVKLRMRSDVKVGGALSGGVDSSSIACVIKKVLKHSDYETFSACFNQKQFDEREYIEEVNKDIQYPSNFVFPKGDTFFETVSKQIWYQDEPINAMWVNSQWHLYECASAKGVKVFLNGHGSDEVLAGYYPHFYYLYAQYISKLKFGQLFRDVGAFRQKHPNHKLSFKKILNILAASMVPESLKKMKRKMPVFLDANFYEKYGDQKYKRDCTDTRDYLKKNLYESFFISPIPGMLHFEDRNSMAFSMESRQPFLDYRLIEHAFTTPSSIKMKDGVNKSILRAAMKDILTPAILNRTEKKGFQSAGAAWFQGEQKEGILDLFHSDVFKNRGYFNQKEVLKEFNAHAKSKKDAHEKIWSWISLEMWFRKFIDENEELRHPHYGKDFL